METNIPGFSFTAIDFEAANSNRESACAVGVTTVRDGLVTDSQSWLIKPHTGIESFDPYAVRIHGITPAMVADAPSLKESAAKLQALIGDGPVLAHNMGYDKAVLRCTFDIAGLPAPDNEFRGTETLSRAALRLGKHKLHLVAEHLGLPAFTQHDAGADALTCAPHRHRNRAAPWSDNGDRPVPTTGHRLTPATGHGLYSTGTKEGKPLGQGYYSATPPAPGNRQHRHRVQLFGWVVGDTFTLARIDARAPSLSCT